LQNDDGSLKGKFDLIIMCETLYNKEYYPSLMDFIHYLKKDDNAEVLIGTKTFYYGLGGGFYDF
jgi:hypothetical protein